MAKPQPAEVKAFVVNVGINYPDDKRAEPGDVVTDIPAHSVRWLLEQGAISPKEG